MKKILAYHILSLFLLSTCTQVVARPVPAIHKQSGNAPVVMILGDNTSSASKTIANNIRKALDYSKIPYKMIMNHSRLENIRFLSSIKVVVITYSEVRKVSPSTVRMLEQFIANGRSLIFTSLHWNEELRPLEGIKPNVNLLVDNSASGFHFASSALPGLLNKSYSAVKHNGARINAFESDDRILITAQDDEKYPVLLEHPWGKGTVWLYNTSSLSDKLYRGLLFSTIIRNLPGFPYPVANVGTIFIDDFPEALFNRKLPPVNKEYNITESEFVAKVWWPDIKALADTMHLAYTAMTTFNYNSEVIPPFGFKQWENGKADINGRTVNSSLYLAQQVRKSGNELGLHGYNHISLRLKDWPSQQFMMSALRSAIKQWRIDELGPLPSTYVPPTNWIDSTGLRALTKSIPSLKYMCSTYLGNVKAGGGREFDVDPYNPKLFDYPRISDGYMNSTGQLFREESVYLMTGIWTHFIHPDDIFDIKPRADDPFGSRNPLHLWWHNTPGYGYGLYELFRKHLVETRNINPLMQFKTARKAVPIVEKWRSMSVQRKSDENGLHVSMIFPDGEAMKSTCWFTWVDSLEYKRFIRSIRGQATRLASVRLWDGYLVQMETNRNTITFPRVDSKSGLRFTGNVPAVAQFVGPGGDADSQNKSSKANPLISLERKARFSHGWDKIRDLLFAHYVDAKRMKAADSLVSLVIFNDHHWPRKAGQRMYDLYNQQNRLSDLWDVTNRRWKKYPDSTTLSLEHYFRRRLGYYLNTKTRDRWLARAMAYYPNNDSLKAEYLKLHQDQKHWKRSKAILKGLFKRHPQSDSLYHFALQHSLWYDSSATTLSWLRQFPKSANKQLYPLAKEIADLYAYVGHNLEQALRWSKRDPHFPINTKLQWFLDAHHYKQFSRLSDSLLQRQPNNDSLRIFLSRAYFDIGKTEDAIRTAEPLFKKHRAPKILSERVNQSFGDWNKKKAYSIMKKYPDAFSDPLASRIRMWHRQDDGIRITLGGYSADDNFSNSERWNGIGIGFGNVESVSSNLFIGRTQVGSDIDGNRMANSLGILRYDFNAMLGSSSRLTLKAGTWFDQSELLPGGGLSFWTAKGYRYQSYEMRFNPVLTNTAILKHYYAARIGTYREDPWFGNFMLTSLSLDGRYYTNDVWMYESSLRVTFANDQKGTMSLKPFIESDWMDATKNYDLGIPYWTPHKLFVYSAGLHLGINKGQRLNMYAEVMGQHDEVDGYYLSGSANLNVRIWKFWNVKFSSNLSTSRVYRSNILQLSVTYTLPAN